MSLLATGGCRFFSNGSDTKGGYGGGNGNTPAPAPVTPTPAPVTPAPAPTPAPTPSTGGGAGKTGGIVGAYFVEWGVYGRKYGVDDVPFDKITHLIFSFIPICGPNDSLRKDNPSGASLLDSECKMNNRKNGEITIHDTFADLNPPHDNFKKLAAKKAQFPNVKILPSIGGWTLSDPFFEVSSTAANRKVFIDSCVAFLNTYKFFDGIDIDWEYPGGGGLSTTLGGPQDKANHLALFKELRAALDIAGKANNREYLITSAVGAAPAKINAVDYKGLFSAGAMDLIFAMTYDYYGAWSGVRGHQAGLYEGNKLEEGFDSASTINNLMTAGVPAKNLVLGVAMYGRAWQGVTGEGMSKDMNDNVGVAFAKDGAAMWEPGILDYKHIQNTYRNNPAYKYVWDAKAKAASLWSASEKKLISYEDACSTKHKLDFAKEKGLGGVFAWEIDADNGDILGAMNGAQPAGCQ